MLKVKVSPLVWCNLYAASVIRRQLRKRVGERYEVVVLTPDEKLKTAEKLHFSSIAREGDNIYEEGRWWNDYYYRM